jgi:hypothetical protein
MSQCQKAGRETCQPDLTLAPTSPGRQVKSKLCTLTVRDIALDMRGLSSHNPQSNPVAHRLLCHNPGQCQCPDRRRYYATGPCRVSEVARPIWSSSQNGLEKSAAITRMTLQY